jgi:Ice-binding-like
MALTATIALNTLSVQIEQPATATITISNSSGSPAGIASIAPYAYQTGDPRTEDASSFALSQIPFSQGMNNLVPASGSMPQSFTCVFHAPSSRGSAPYLGPVLGTADSYAILAGSAITNTGASVINGNVGLSPGSSITPGGWTVTGRTDVDNPAAVQAQNDLTTAYNFLVAQPTTMDLSGQDLGGKTLQAGVYNFSSSAGLTGTLTLDGAGNPNSVFIFKIGSTLTTATASSVVFINGAVPGNVFWQVGSSATLGTSSQFNGSILALTSITENGGAGATSGRLLARNGAVTISAAAIVSTQPNSGQQSGSAGSYSIGAICYGSDGSVFTPAEVQLNVTPVLPVF